jgi:hypothetical protein
MGLRNQPMRATLQDQPNQTHPMNLSLRRFPCVLAALLGVVGARPLANAASAPTDGWQQIASLPRAQSRLAISHWPNDKYPNLAELTPGAKTVLLDTDGPGVVTLFHVSKYQGGDQGKLMLRVWYDGQAKAALEMPWMDFLGDVEARTAHFSTVYFSHVKESHNFRLPMPFRKHIRIEVENPTEQGFGGYTDIQWEKLDALPPETGYLHAEYRTGAPVIPDQTIVACDIRGPGAIVAHWLQLQADQPETVNSDFICEANQELYLDGSASPQMEYLGSEDLYGFSWGMGGGIQSDHYAAITRMERWKSGGLFTMLRCRTTDRIQFTAGCRWVINYQQEFFSALSKNPRHQSTPKRSFEMPFKSCIYYYAPGPG